MHQLPLLSDLLSSLRVVSLPLSIKFRQVTNREIALFEGPNGWAEFSPFLEYQAAEASHWLTAAIEYAYQPLPARLRAEVPINATLPAVAAADAAAVLKRYGKFRTVKIKVAERGQHPDEDIARVAAVRNAHPEQKIRVDANGNWSVDEAERMLRALSKFDLEYAEQPCQTTEELAELRSRDTGVRIAADESIRKACDPYRVAELAAADLIVLKAQPLGGISRCLALSDELKLPCVVSSGLESSIGLSQGVLLAASLPELQFDCGLGTATLLAADVTKTPLRSSTGCLPVTRPDVDQALLARYEVASSRLDWWRNRIEACYRILENS